ncbi:hypothetical protein ABE287_13640 [Bacillus velezensis]
MNETNGIKEFGEINSVLGYLGKVKQDLHNKSFSEQIEFKEEIKKRHDKSQIQMFLGRLEDLFEVKKAKSYLITPAFAIISLFIGFFINLFIKESQESDFSPIIIILFISLLYIMVVVFWGSLLRRETNNLRKIKRYKRLLQECLDEMPEKRQFRRRV